MLNPEFRKTNFIRTLSCTLDLLLWGALACACMLLTCLLCWGTVITLWVQPRSSLLVFSGVVLTSSLTVYTSISCYAAWCDWQNWLRPDWTKRLIDVVCWTLVVYVGLCMTGIWLLENTSIVLLDLGLIITSFGCVGTWRRAISPEVEQVCGCEEGCDTLN